MNDKISVKPDTIYLEDLLEEIANGGYQIPVFQREFVWKTSQILESKTHLNANFQVISIQHDFLLIKSFKWLLALNLILNLKT